MMQMFRVLHLTRGCSCYHIDPYTNDRNPGYVGQAMLDPVTPWKNVSKRRMSNQDRLGRRRTHGEQRKYWSKCTFATGGLAPAATTTEDQINSMILLVSSHISQCIALSIWKIYRGGSLSTVPRFGTSEPVIFNRKSVVDRMKSALP